MLKMTIQNRNARRKVTTQAYFVNRAGAFWLRFTGG